MAANATLSTPLSSLSPLLSFSPCIASASSSDCDWTTGWKQGWDNDGPWSGLSQRYAQGWAVAGGLSVQADLTGTGVSFLLQPTSFYNLTLSVNGTVLSSVPDLSTSTSANLTSLPFGTHSVQAIFHSKDTTREPSQEGVARLTGIEVHWEGSNVSTTNLDDSAWESSTIALSSGWNLMSTSNPSNNILNQTQASLLTPLLSSALNNSLSWTSEVNAFMSFTFEGNYLALYAPLSPMVGSFVPSIDGVAYPTVDAAKNVGLDDDITGGQVVWSVSGLGEGSHEVSLRNEGRGGEGVMMVDYVQWATVEKMSATVASSSSRVVSSASSTSPTPASSKAAAAASTSSAASTKPSTNNNSVSQSESIGIYVAVAVGGIALLGLLVLLVFKCRQRRNGSTLSPFSSSGPSAASANAGGGTGRRIGLNAPSSFIGNPKPFKADPKSGPARAFHPLAESSLPQEASSDGNAPPIWSAKRTLSSSVNLGPGPSGLPQPAYMQPLSPPPSRSSEPEMSNRPSIVPFGASTITIRTPTDSLHAPRPKSSAAEIGDFSEAGDHSSSSNVVRFGSYRHAGESEPSGEGEGGGGLDVPRGASTRDSRSVYSDDLSGAHSNAGGEEVDLRDYGHGQSEYSLGQYYDPEGDGEGGEGRRSRGDGMRIDVEGEGRWTDEVPLTPPMEETPSARRRVATSGKGTPDTFGNPLGNYF